MNVICLGDSNTWGYDPRGYFGGRYDCPWPELLAQKTSWNVTNKGLNGREIPVGEYAFPENCDLLIVMLGTNDLLQLWLPEDAAGRMEAFVSRFSEKERRKLLLIAPPVMAPGEWVQDNSLIENSQALAAAYEKLSECLDLRFANAGKWNIPLVYDGVHFTELGHRIFAEKLYKILNATGG